MCLLCNKCQMCHKRGHIPFHSFPTYRVCHGQGAGETFRAWLAQKPAMMRLSPFRRETNLSHRFAGDLWTGTTLGTGTPGALEVRNRCGVGLSFGQKRERELLLQHFAATERCEGFCDVQPWSTMSNQWYSHFGDRCTSCVTRIAEEQAMQAGARYALWKLHQSAGDYMTIRRWWRNMFASKWRMEAAYLIMNRFDMIWYMIDMMSGYWNMLEYSGCMWIYVLISYC